MKKSHDSKTNQTEHYITKNDVTIGLVGSSSQKNAGGHCLWMGVHPKYPKVSRHKKCTVEHPCFSASPAAWFSLQKK